MKLQAACDADADLVYCIKRDAYSEYATRAYGRWDEAFQRRFTQDHLPSIRLMVVDDVVVGWIAVTQSEDAEEIVDLHVPPRHQRRGYGCAALQAVIDEASLREKAVTLQVLKINPSRGLYERHGFVATGETSTHIVMRRKPDQASRDGICR